jgi:enterochelin esterase-like enzyme
MRALIRIRLMSSFSLVIAIFIFSSNFVTGIEGELKKNLTHKSEILGRDVLYNVYLPPGYSTENDYPVLFFLHWFGGDNNSANSWAKNIDSLITIKEFPEIIIIAPDAKITWYIDDYRGSNKYSSMFIEEFLPLMNENYSLCKLPKNRAVMGSSMGGFGALRFTMLYPDQFGICISFMSGISTKEQIISDNDEDYKTYHQNLYGENLKGDARVNEHFIKNNPLYIAEKLDLSVLTNTKWYIQTCDDDYHSLPNAELHALFHKRNVKHEFRVNNGVHDGDCVRSTYWDSLNFLKESIISQK